MRGSGKAEIYYMLAHPVGHAKSPGIFNDIFEAQGRDALMVPVSCRPEDFEAFWAGVTATENVLGVIVSVPYKAAVFEKCSGAHERAARVRSANSVRRQPDGTWYADNFDGVGFVDALKDGGHAMAGRRALLVGAGGAGASLAYCLAEEGVVDLRICDVDQRRAERLAGLVGNAFPGCRVAAGSPDPVDADLVVNATPMGLRPDDPLPLDASRLTAAMTVMDIIMEPAETKLILAAREAGCRIQLGRPMMDFQVRGMSEFFGIDREGGAHG